MKTIIKYLFCIRLLLFLFTLSSCEHEYDIDSNNKETSVNIEDNNILTDSVRSGTYIQGIGHNMPHNFHIY